MKTCPKCSYARTPRDDKVPEWQCPKCGVAYAKFEDQQGAGQAVKRTVAPATAAPAASPMSATALFFILAGVLALGYAGYKKFYGPAEAESEPGLAQILASGGGPPPEALIMTPEALSALAQITPSKVVLFSTAWCGYCAKVKQLLGKQGVRFTELDVEQDPRYLEFQKQNMRIIGFPVLVVGRRIVGGYDEGAILAALKEL